MYMARHVHAQSVHDEVLPTNSDCELFIGGFWGQPVNTATSFAFVVVGAIILARSAGSRRVLIFGLLAIGTGVGSVISHGPAPAWGEIVHDAPLVGILAFVAVDAISDLSKRELTWVWWVIPTVLALAVSEIGEPARIAAQTSITVLAIGASLLRFVKRPATRRTILTAGLLLGAGALIGTLSRSGMPLCNPDSLLQGHAIWHVMAAAAIWRLTPVVGTRGAIAALPLRRQARD
ncbi:Hypothetical membrane protein [Hoyosella subflava DQS3-9A1]|uniref:Hypothetical membrane protein n=2 Tax=Hoyosella TaxID=697025 RepID=F6EIC2_HOYSD|nr:Hypothetical membrane protein [Hoyosella subflava DQS3-9A1]